MPIYNSEVVHSPLSSQPPIRLVELPRQRIIQELSLYFGKPCPVGAVECDYTLWRCAETSLEFAVPPIPGNQLFYQWISQFHFYYPKFRWEYDRVLSRLKEAVVSNFSLLDVGCGSGEFLETFKSLGLGKCFGLDFNNVAIETCRNKGLAAFCGSIQEAIKARVLKKHQFSVVVSFHCLEHVPDPLSFLRDLLDLTAASGRIFLSTPASPMSFEASWFDVMNHPPHHITRWSLNAYRKAAEILGLNLSYYFPNTSYFRQALQIRRLKSFRKLSTIKTLIKICLSPKEGEAFLRTWFKCRQRSTQDPLNGSDVILVEFSRK